MGPTGFEWGDEIVCADPFEGWNRFASVGVERGLTEPMADPSEVLDMRVFGMEPAGNVTRALLGESIGTLVTA